MYIELITVILLVEQCFSFSYPVFGTKRYHRANNNNLKHLVNPVPMPQYYDEPYLSYPEYQDDGSYYYLPRRDTHLYGQPTYRGEYKPTTYYYAHGPSYSYFDDRQEQANPLDDLHEEMLQEDQRERQRELPPIGQKNWFDKSERQQDKLTNAFLKNLILYNKQVNKVQQFENNENGEFDEYADGTEYYEDAMPQQSQLDDYEVQNGYDNFNRQPYENTEDKNVRELKLLANKNSNFRHNNNNDHYSLNQQNDYYSQTHQMDQFPNSDNHQPMDYMQDSYETEPEYDDSWTHWDKKRSLTGKLEKSGKSEIGAHNIRKPSPVAAHFQQPIPTLKPHHHIFTSTFKTPGNNLKQEVKQVKPVHIGQKEIVLPRPANPVRRPFTEPIMEMLSHNSIQDKRSSKSDGKAANKIDQTSSVFNTIKRLLEMEQNLNFNEASQPKLQMHKRFVSSEGSLVQELDGLKRVAA